MREVVVVGAVRTAIGKRNGALAGRHATELLGDALRGLVEKTGVDPGAVEHVIGGCVNQLGMQASNVARHAWLAAGLPMEVPAVTVNVQCGSSQEATTLAHGLVAGALADVVIACGVEIMSRVPLGSTVPAEPDYGSPRGGAYADHYEPTTQFEGAERMAEQWGLGRDDLEAYAVSSQERAAAAWAGERFSSQIVPVDAPVTDDQGTVLGTKVFDRDEGLRSTTLEGLASLQPTMRDRSPAFHTAGTSSQISDGASAVLLMTAERATALGIPPLARLVDSVLIGSDPVLMLTGPIVATRRLLERTGIAVGDIDVFEVNEAFASVVLAWQHQIHPDPVRVNPNGGAIALGHPLGASGTVLLTKAVHELVRSGGRYGLITMCCGGGVGTGTVLERI